MTKYKLFKKASRFLIPLIIMGGFLEIFSQAQTPPAKTIGTNTQTEKTNYLDAVIEGLTPGAEKDFFLALAKDRANQENLMEALKLLAVKRLEPFGTARFPGKEPEPLYIDNGESQVLTYRHKLRWEKHVITPEDSFRVLLFRAVAGYSFRQSGPCLIITTDTGYKVRRWIQSTCYEHFINASLEKSADGYLFKIEARMYHWEKDSRLNRYKITATEIKDITFTN